MGVSGPDTQYCLYPTDRWSCKIPILERLFCVDGVGILVVYAKKEKSRIEWVESDHEVTAATQKVHCYNEYTKNIQDCAFDINSCMNCRNFSDSSVKVLMLFTLVLFDMNINIIQFTLYHCFI